MTWTAVSCFMSVTTLFFAMALVEDTERRLDMLLKGYVAIAVVAAVFGIVTYFHLLPDSDPFLFASRSRSTFKDPNVLGAFLVLPCLLALQRTMTGRLRDFLVGGAMTAVHGDRAAAGVFPRRLGRIRRRGRLDAGADLSSPAARAGSAAASSRSPRSAPSPSAR